MKAGSAERNSGQLLNVTYGPFYVLKPVEGDIYCCLMMDVYVESALLNESTLM